VDEHITLIVEPHADPLVRGNIWHIRGRDRDLLIDSGLGVTSLRPAFPDLFDREPILVVTHAHLDHMGSAHEFEHRWAHPNEPLAHPLPGSLTTRNLLANYGMNPAAAADEPELLITARPTPRYNPVAYRLQPAPPTKALDDGDTIDLGDRQLTVLHLPGHTPGSIALYDSDQGILFSGEVVYDEELIDVLPDSDIDAYLATMRRLRDLPVHIVQPGHESSFGQERLRQLADDYITSRTPSPRG
jgi:glyoxylase-like metal-dependent hydrolase (beta-lactamase superfamily II)